jgi:hypothetical protein
MGLIQVLAKGKQFLPLLTHLSCYSTSCRTPLCTIKQTTQIRNVPSWLSVLLVGEIRVHGNNHGQPLAGTELTTLVIILSMY